MRDWNLVAVAAIRSIRDQGEESFFWWCWWWWIVGSFLFFLVALGFVVLIHSLPILIRCLIAETVSHAQFLGLSPDFHKSLGSKGDQYNSFLPRSTLRLHIDLALAKISSVIANCRFCCQSWLTLACMYSCSLRQAPPYTCYARPSKKKKPLGQIRGQNPQHAQTTSDEWVWLILKTRLVGLSWVCFCLLRIWPRLDNLTFSLNYIEQDLVGMSLNFTNSFQSCQKKMIYSHF